MRNAIYGIPTIRIRTLGEFSFEDEECKYIVDIKKQSQVVVLLQYIILNRNRIISTDELIKVIWNNQVIENPNNALKNLIYRLRNILAQRLSFSKLDYILHKKGGYMWNNTISTFVDIDEIEHFYKISENESNSIDTRIKFLTQAMEIYKGEFMPGSNSFELIYKFREKYENLYNDCIEKKIALLNEENNYMELSRFALNMYNKHPNDNKLIDVYLTALFMDNKYELVIEKYKYFERHLKYENQTISEASKNIYEKSLDAVNATKELDKNINVIVNILKENKCDGAYFCEYETFKDYYRIQMRNIERVNVDMCLIVISVSAINYSDEKKVKDMVNVVKNCCIHSLRKGDAITIFNENQIMLLLYNSNEKNGIKVYERIKNNIQKYYSDDDIEINFSIQQINK